MTLASAFRLSKCNAVEGSWVGGLFSGKVGCAIDRSRAGADERAADDSARA
jgi:hypothetical protein